MLSRVAAVMAPRTHNRCRVTGSRGRRREGRESEPQRPNMSRHLFYSAVLLLVIMCCGSGMAAQSEVKESTVSKFEWKNADDDGLSVKSLGVPGLLKVGSDVFAVAEATCGKEDDDNTFTGIASQLLTIDKGKESKEEFPKDAKKGTKVLEKGVSQGKKKKVDVSRPTTIVKGSDIYMLVGKYSEKPAAGVSVEGGADDSGLLLVKGKVGDEGNKQIDWKETTDLSRAAFGEELQSLEELIGSGGSGFEMKGDKLVFPVEGTMKGDAPNGEKAISLLIYTSDNAASWKLSKGMSDDGCGDPSVVGWGEKDKKLIMMTACDDGRRRVYESDDKGESWTEALGTLSRVWGNKQDEGAKAVRSGFITATIDGDENKRNVMLVTLPVYPKETDTGDNEKGKLHLWLTDNTHIVDIGPVSDDDAAASSLLYRSAKDETNEKEELIALYEKKKGDDGKSSPGMVSVPLTEQLQRVKDVLATWKEVDEIVSKLCPSSDVESDSPENACSPTVKITDGLVGFLSGNFSDNTWRDEYLGVNTTVKNNEEGNKATLHEGSVTFTGAWAEWPVGSQGENQLYHFANYNFTLVATVSIDKVPKEEGSPIPLMGAKMNDDGKTVLLGLSYNGGGKWKLSCGGGQNKDHSSDWEPDTTHQVAIVLQNGTQGSAYVDDILVGNAQCNLQDMDSTRISHFYIGGDGSSTGSEEDVSVTVTNVLLYNRPLSSDEIAGLAKNKITIPKPEVPKTSTTSSLSPAVSGSDVQRTVSQSSSAGQLQSEQGQPKGSIAAGVGGASTPVTSTAAASSGQKPVKQLTSGTSPSGNKNADGAPSSDADPTVTSGTSPDGGQTVDGGSTADSAPTTDTREGETDVQQEKEEVNTHNGEVKAAALSSSLGNVSQGNNTDAGTVCESRMLPSLLLLGLWVFAAL
ncbi:putative trans-sialidase, Group V [Trypanosoma cruzi]|nr:putative trans-sialidase, Group V [Trypanosoma cruzi]